jgi:hypothetical protein
MSTALQEFAADIVADNSLAAQSVVLGDKIELAEIAELLAGVRSIYNLATLASRDHSRITDCHALWLETLGHFEQLCGAWVGVQECGELIGWYRIQLEHLRGLCADRVELFQPEGADRRRLIANKREAGSEYSFSTRDQIPA